MLCKYEVGPCFALSLHLLSSCGRQITPKRREERNSIRGPPESGFVTTHTSEVLSLDTTRANNALLGTEAEGWSVLCPVDCSGRPSSILTRCGHCFPSTTNPQLWQAVRMRFPELGALVGCGSYLSSRIQSPLRGMTFCKNPAAIQVCTLCFS